jgi:hypothetical protein
MRVTLACVRELPIQPSMERPPYVTPSGERITN